MPKSRVRRISADLDKELREFAAKNNMKLIQADMEIAKRIKNAKGKKERRDIIF